MVDELDIVFGVVSPTECPALNLCASAAATRSHLLSHGLWRWELLRVLLPRRVLRRGLCSGGCPLLGHLRQAT
jgi:hypothetical protein